MPVRGPRHFGPSGFDPVLAGIAVAVTAVGLMVLTGWALHVPALVRLAAGWTPMVVNTALSFVACGVALWLSQRHPRGPNRLAVMLGALVALLAAIVLLDIWLDFAPALAQPDLHRPLQADTPRPGRMAPNTALGFLLAGAAFTLPALLPRWRVAGLIEGMGVIVGSLGLLGLTGYALQLEYLYSWSGVVRMAAHTAATMLLLGAGLVRWAWLRRQVRAATGDELRGIGRAAALVLTVVTLAAGLLGFSLLQARVDGVLRTQVARWANERRVYFDLSLLLRSEHADIVTKDTALAVYLQGLLAGGAEEEEALARLRNWASELAPHGFTGIALEAQGRRWLLHGSFVRSPDLSVPLRGAHAGWLLWKDGFHLLRRVPVSDDRAPKVPVLITEQALRYLNRINRPQPDWGDTGEVIVCAQPADELRCFPSRHNPEVFALPPKPAGEQWPVQRAIAGESGVAVTLDYQDRRVLAGFGPIGDTGIGLVAKIDSAEIYAPIRQQLQRALPALALLVLLGLALLRMRLGPLLVALARSREQLGASQARFAAVIESALDVFMFLQPVRDSRGRIENFRLELVNGEAERLLSQPRAALIGRLVSDVVPPAVFAQLLGPYANALTEGAAMLELEEPGDGADSRWFSHQLVPAGGGLAVTVRDITDDRRQSEEHRYQALHDSLTGLLNRAGFGAEVDALLAQPDAGVVAFAIFDVDRFKQVNDTYGHDAGDQLLRAIAQRLQEQMRPGDIVARLGGDEFVLALRDPQYPRAVGIVAEKLVAAMAQPFHLGGLELQSGISLGACAWPLHGTDRAALLGCADASMYRIKQRGRNGFEVQPPPT